ncbi:PQQ-binding-like beta-propeller repeat protein [Planctomycetota bacterium]
MRLMTAVLLALVLSTMVCADDWPQWRGPNRDGISAEKDLMATWPPKKVWSFEAGLGYSAVSVSNGRAYVMGNVKREGDRGIDTVFCLDAADGKVLWKHRYECTTSKSDKQAAYSGPRATPVVDGDVVYTVSLEGWLFCLGAADGKVRWFQELNKYAFEDLSGLLYGYCSTPVVYEDKLFCYVNGALMAFEKKTGKPIWRCKGGRPLWNGSSPIIAELGGKICAVFGEEELVGADVATGDKVWSHVIGRTAVIAPVVMGDKVFYSSYPNRGACGVFQVNAENGTTTALWASREIQIYHAGNPVLKDGCLYSLDAARTEYLTRDKKVSSLKCIDFETGKVKWKQKKMGWAQLILADDKLFILREEGELVVVQASPEEYKELGRAKLAEGVYWAGPALADGRLYCRSNSGTVTCLKVSKSSEGDQAPAPANAGKAQPKPEKTEKDG